MKLKGNQAERDIWSIIIEMDEKLIKSVKERIEPRCPYFGVCGGCQLQDIPYPLQLELKQQYVKDCLTAQGLTDVKVEPVLGMDEPWFYRNKIQFPIRSQNGRLQMGYFKPRSHEVVNIKECYIQDPFLTEVALIAHKVFERRGLSAYDEKTGQGVLRHFIGRSAFATNEMLLGIVVNGRGLPAGYTVADEIKRQERLMHRLVARHQDYPRYEEKRRIVGIVQNINNFKNNVILGDKYNSLFGGTFIIDKLGKYTFKIQLPSFYQVNPVQAVKLYDAVRDLAALTGRELVIDAFAGIGPIAFWLSTKAREVVGIEECEPAVKDALENIKLNNFVKITMKHGKVEHLLTKKADVVVLDPPRGGCTEKVLMGVARSEAKKIIYVSCNPETLARDLKFLEQRSYKTTVVQPVDMFPHTSHIESVAVLVKT